MLLSTFTELENEYSQTKTHSEGGRSRIREAYFLLSGTSSKEQPLIPTLWGRINQPASSLSEEDDVAASNSHVVSVSSLINTRCDSFASHDDNAIYFYYVFIDTPGGSVYWVPRVSTSVLPVLGTVYDSLDECIEMYRKYTLEASFGVVFDMVAHTSKYTLTTFNVEHNHELDRVEYKHLSKAERKLTYNEQLFIIKAANANIGAVRAHNLYTGLKGSSSLVHGTQTKFKNFTCGVNGFIGDSDAQMLITRMKERQEFTKFLLTISLRMLSFVVYFGMMKLRSVITRILVISYKMVFVPFTAIDNHRRSVTIGSGLLKKETAEAYGWLLRAFKKAFVRPPNIVVTDQDGAMRLAVAAEFPDLRNRLHVGKKKKHIMQKIPAKLCLEFMMILGKIVWNMFIGLEEFEDRWDKLMEEFNLAKLNEGCTICIIDEEKIKHVGLSEVIDKESTSENVEEEINLHQKVTGHYKVLYNKGDGSVSCCCQLLVRSGILCRHIFCVFKNFKVSYIPDQYILSRWTTDLRNKKNRYGEKNEAIEKLAMEASIILDSCVHMLRNNEPKLSICVKKPNKVKVKNPTGVRPKGREKQKRIKSGREILMKKSMRKSNKKKNGYGVCGSTDHNRRTCPQKNDVDVLYPTIVVPGGSDHVDGGLRNGASEVVVPGGSDQVDGRLRDGASRSVSV
ncbi:FAR1-related sequence 5-like protein [Tanacetum coccineum]